MSILAVGTVAFDSIETPFGSADHILGGSATYITLASRYFTDRLGLVGVVGDDFPSEYIEQLTRAGINLDGLEVKKDGRTFAWEGRYHYDLNERDTLATHLNVLEHFQPVVPDAFASAPIVCLGNLAPTTQQDVLNQVSNPELVICDTMNFWIENTYDDLLDTLRDVDCLIINDSEARQLADEPNLISAVGTIRAMGPRIVVIKKGEHGALLFVDDCIFSAPAYPLEDVHDPTGAGDAFAGGFAGFLARTRRYGHDDLKRAVVYGSALASFVVEAFGPERLYDLDLEQIDERAETFYELSAVPDLKPLFQPA